MTKPRTPVARAKLIADAINRSGRAALQAIAVEVGLVVLPEVVRLLADPATVWNYDIVMGLLRVAGMAAAAYLHRAWLDRTRVPSLLPPADPGIPAEPPA